MVRERFLMTLDADTSIALPATASVRTSPEIGAIAFTIVAADTDRFLADAQAVEYTYVLNFERVALAGFGIVLTVPGAASLWRAEALRQIGGFSSRTCAEDTDATITLQSAGWRIGLALDVVATTNCPSTIRKLIRQRARWIWGNLQAAFYALAPCFLPGRTAQRGPSLVMIAISVMIVGGYAVATATLVRLTMLDVGLIDVAASAVLFFATVMRIIVIRRLQTMPERGMIAVLIALLSMQAINLAGFWYGTFARRRRW